MKKIWDRFMVVLPTIWGVLWCAIITMGSFGFAVHTAKWLLNVLGVM